MEMGYCVGLHPIRENALFLAVYIFYSGIVVPFKKEKGKKILVWSVRSNVIPS